MPNEIKMPDLSATGTPSTLLRWLVAPGDTVRRGQAVAEIETDKATTEVESTANGTIERLLLEEGESAEAGTPIATLTGEAS